ncbi:PfkB family carbohydrate kinase [Ereboglobus luteus]|uniref:Carbohydrate kinase PfkB domain-containing protein n=1 Tax=Ereboglobus luteus TaxID=1796921 RepID=A0A2U8E263_9BACT|nr:PfkB family carbohydrate kinase [Ereboglobus luteus]AWI08866.1 hypothetical protein CKA38_06010 [Ereboglobus luteus]
MIITLTGNLLAERTFEFASWQPGGTQRATAESFQVGGKGINVSKMLANLGAPTLAVCFAGGETGDECLCWLEARGLPHHAFRAGAPTRSGTVVRAPDRAETTFLGVDVEPGEAAFSECAAWLDAQPPSHSLAICGSFPGLLAPAGALLREAIVRRVAHGNVFVDTYGLPLAWLVNEPVALVKINRNEFDQLCASVKNPELARALSPSNPMPDRLAAACRNWPVRAWVITDGPGPVWHAGAPADGRVPVPVSHQPPAIREVSATGSGDVLFAVLLHNLKNRHFSLADAVANAIPYASANASTSTLAEINEKQD